MATQQEPEIILYDLACTKNVCFSSVVWRIRMMLNYKGVAYKTVFLEYPDIEPTLKGLGLEPHETPSEVAPRYTVPTIHHLPSNRYLMGSKPIAEYLQQVYLKPALLLQSPHGNRIEAEARAMSSGPYGTSVLRRMPAILSPRAQDYFRQTRQAAQGHSIEDFTDSEKEDQAWNEASSEISALGELIRKNHSEGPFVLGAQPSYTDFFIAGSLQSARVVDESVFNRMMEYTAFKDVYDACLPFMEKKD